jgi:hypothetical protein
MKEAESMKLLMSFVGRKELDISTLRHTNLNKTGLPSDATEL